MIKLKKIYALTPKNLHNLSTYQIIKISLVLCIICMMPKN